MNFSMEHIFSDLFLLKKNPQKFHKNNTPSSSCTPHLKDLKAKYLLILLIRSVVYNKVVANVLLKVFFHPLHRSAHCQSCQGVMQSIYSPGSDRRYPEKNSHKQ